MEYTPALHKPWSPEGLERRIITDKMPWALHGLVPSSIFNVGIFRILELDPKRPLTDSKGRDGTEVSIAAISPAASLTVSQESHMG